METKWSEEDSDKEGTETDEMSVELNKIYELQYYNHFFFVIYSNIWKSALVSVE